LKISYKFKPQAGLAETGEYTPKKIIQLIKEMASERVGESE
jgi:hypothetical protein